MSHPIGSIKLVQGLLSRTRLHFKAMACGCPTCAARQLRDEHRNTLVSDEGMG
jgi:hypothetical protein